MKLFTSLFIVCLLLTLSFGVVVEAATEGTVTATVTAQNVAVSVTDGTIAYGTMVLNTTVNTALFVGDDALSDTQTATNDGNVSADLDIKGINTVGDTPWTLDSTNETLDHYVHEFCNEAESGCDVANTELVWTLLSTEYQQLTTGLAAGGTQDFDTQITTPTSSTDFTSKSVNVLVQISAA